MVLENDMKIKGAFTTRMKIKFNHLILFSLFTITNLEPCLCQKDNSSQKGATPIITSNKTKGTTRAVIVGISDYQSPEIPDLKFADKDAIAFAEWLQSTAGGNVPSANIQLLTNQNATHGKFGAALDWLKEVSNEDDQAIIYFSGHGDIEVSLRSQPGFLLCWDAPPKVYTAGGAFGLVYLQDIVSTISIDKKAQVLVIADACHSGKLAGSGNGGSQATAMTLMQQFANEIKILSCQPNEYSVEGVEWGGGRGIFSFYLLEGLTGLADINKDAVITLSEIDQFLEEKVVAEAKPQKQTPFAIGDKQSIVSNVNPEALLALVKSKDNKNEEIETIGFRGTVDNYLILADTLIKQLYNEFEFAIQKSELIESVDPEKSAIELFLEINQIDPSSPLISIMRRNLAAALQDEVQQALNAVLDDNPYEIKHWRFNKSKYIKYADYLELTIKLLGTGHYKYQQLMAKKLFFESFNLVHYSAADYKEFSDSSKKIARQKLHHALKLHESAYIYYLLANTFMYDYASDSIEIYYKKAMDLAPNWKLPYSEIAWYYLDLVSQYENADYWLRKGLLIDSNSYQLLEMSAWLYQRLNNLDSIKSLCIKMRKLHPDLANDYGTLSCSYAFLVRDFALAEIYSKMAAKIDSFDKGLRAFVIPYIYINTRRMEDAKKITTPIEFIYPFYTNSIFQFNRMDDLIKLDSVINNLAVNVHFPDDYYFTLQGYLGVNYCLMHRYDSAENVLRRALNLYSNINNAKSRELFYLGLVCGKRSNYQEAEDFFIKASKDSEKYYNYQAKPVYSEGFFLYGEFLIQQKRYSEAEQKFRYIIKRDYGCHLGFYGMAILRSIQGKDKEALDWLEKALDWYFPRPEPIYEEPAFKNIKKNKRFKEMMEKNFPKGWE